MPLYNNIIIKIGSNVVTRPDGFPDVERIGKIVEQIAALKKLKIQVTLVSSGAVASGRSVLNIPEKTDPVAARQQLAAVGQIKLIHTYSELFAQHGFICAQVLVTKGDFRDRRHYLNMKSCVNNLLKNNIIPVVNENDVISVTELMFTDNDELSGLLASMLEAEALILLSSVDGLYDGKPNDPASKLIPVVNETNADFSYVSGEKSNFGRGGMLTKSRMALKLAQVGVNVHIANGKTENILVDLLMGKSCGTHFPAQKNTSGVKKWVAHSEEYAKGKVYINEGAKAALTQSGKATSLLPVGVVRTEGYFEKGDVIKILDENGSLLGIGIARYNSEKTKERILQKKQPSLVHYDYLYLK